MATSTRPAMRVNVVAVAAAMTLAACGAGSTSNDDVAGAPVVRAHVAGDRHDPLSPAELFGTWRPVVLFGRDVSDVARVNGSPVTVRFYNRPQSGWTGYDGCNWTSGPFRVARSGAFSATARMTTTRGCLAGRGRTTNVTVMTRADRVALRDGRLSLYGPGGQRIGVYVRAA